MDERKPRRRWLSFGIRDLLWAMVVVGLAIGWWVEYRHDREREGLIEHAVRDATTKIGTLPQDFPEVEVPIRGVIRYSNGTVVEWQRVAKPGD